MKNGHRNFASVADIAILTTIILVACLFLFAGEALAQGGRTATTPDARYGEGGSKVTTKDARDRVIKEEWKDKAGRTIEETGTTYNDKESVFPADTDVIKTVVTKYYRVTKTGRALRTVSIRVVDRIGREEVETSDYNETGEVIEKTIRAPSGLRRFKLNPATGKLEQVVSSASTPTQDAQPATPASPPTTAPAPSTAPAPPPSSEGERTADVMVIYTPFEFYFGFSHNRVDAGDEREGFNGFAASFTGNLSRYVGPKVYYSFHTKSFDDNGFDFSSRASIHQLLGGVQLKDNALEDGPVRPFAHFMAGVAHHRFSVDDGVGSFSDSRTGFGGVAGGGIDFRLNDRADFRVQFDYNPNRIDGEWQHNVRAGFGVVFKFGRRSDDDADDATDDRDPSVAAVPQDPDAKKCEWKRKNLGKDTNVTQVKSDKPTVVEVRTANLAGSGGFEYHCLVSRGTALITYKYTDVDGKDKEEKLRVFCN